MKKITLKVKGMHCPSCEMLIKDSLEEIEGIKKAELDHKKGTAIVEYDEKKVNEALIKSTIAKEGYKVE
jgi:copper chaperone CopZ